jgi:hypothetical protein
MEVGMRDVYEVLRQKELEMVRVRKEVETLLRVIPLLAEDEDRIEYGLASPPSSQQFRGTGTAGEKSWP